MQISFEKLKTLKFEDLKPNIQSLINDKAFLTKTAIGLVIFFINFSLYSIYLSPKLDEQQKKIKTMEDYQKKTVLYNANFTNLQNQINSLKNTPNSVNLFFSKKESEELYQNLSTYATNNGLNITTLNKGNPQKIGGGASAVGKDGKPVPVQSQGGMSYYKIPVTFQVKGSYIGYLKFRLALSKSSKFVNFDTEKIIVNQGDKTNSVTADVAITIVGLPDEFSK